MKDLSDTNDLLNLGSVSTFDWIIVGSGFGASVCAMRLSENGSRVLVLEKGKRFRDQDFPKTNWQLTRYLWFPKLRLFGIQAMSFFKNVVVLHGAGVGGGSLVYANTLVQPKDAFFENPEWSRYGDWKGELLPHYETAKRMLGVTRNPRVDLADRLIEEAAKSMGRGHTFQLADVGVYFGGSQGSGSVSKSEVADPYFGGKGPSRSPCIFCGGCMVGCRHGAKNTLVKNYLYFAEKAGAVIVPEREVIDIVPTSKGGYEVHTESSTRLPWQSRHFQKYHAQKVVVAGGVLGTLKLLFRCRDHTKSLFKISNRLGFDVRTNSESLLGVVGAPPKPGQPKINDGIAISSIFHPDDHTHIEPVKYPTGSTFMRVLAAPMADARVGIPRAFMMMWEMVRHPWKTLKLFCTLNWADRSIILLVMQTLDNKMRITMGRSFMTFFKRGLVTRVQEGAIDVPSYIPIGHEVARHIAKQVDGVCANAINEVFFGIPTTAHILGGCPMGINSDQGVISPSHEVHEYPGLFVMDGSTIQANPGVNPSLTITALAERLSQILVGKSQRGS